ncbi:hypothetical protein PIB30_078211 [Stylosanthes scabra]|uniref:Uncharacterized protein n=1 Tax=Stylosanthes scabra TaxID=79078 RepID=A0ABU6RQK5_9FABA|nr:hypothetical protein [Stylosanthes scabra]
MQSRRRSPESHSFMGKPCISITKESTILAKSLVDIASMLKKIKEGQQPVPIILKRQPDAPQQAPAKHAGFALATHITLTNVPSCKKTIQWLRPITSSKAP